jgi:hypothetical protein
MNFLFIGIGRTNGWSASAENAATALNAEQETAVAVNPYGRTSAIKAKLGAGAPPPAAQQE